MQVHRLISLVGAVGIALAVSACDVSTPSQLHIGKMRVRDQMVTETLSVYPLDAVHVSTTARNILRNGGGDATLTIPYLPGAYKEAKKQGAAYKKAFAAEGVTHFSVALVPVTDRQHADKAVVSYRALTANPSANCKRIPGHQGTEPLADVDQYQYGCEIQSVMSKMVADPSDLLGKADRQDNDSARSGTIINPYKVGTPNERMEGMTVSEVGQ